MEVGVGKDVPVGIGVIVHTVGVEVGGGVFVLVTWVGPCEKRLQAKSPITIAKVKKKHRTSVLFMAPL